MKRNPEKNSLRHDWDWSCAHRQFDGTKNNPSTCRRTDCSRGIDCMRPPDARRRAGSVSDCDRNSPVARHCSCGMYCTLAESRRSRDSDSWYSENQSDGMRNNLSQCRQSGRSRDIARRLPPSARQRAEKRYGHGQTSKVARRCSCGMCCTPAESPRSRDSDLWYSENQFDGMRSSL